ncbi:MAG: GH116 family glycosyl-hydrolase, partial [Propionicimonas sp.]|nr:GH116 family glycosyl-hydrolase [Propionicimonas sp.]
MTAGLPHVAAQAAPSSSAGSEIPSAALVRSLGDIDPNNTAPANNPFLCQFLAQVYGITDCNAFLPISTPGMGITLGGIGAGNFQINQSGTFGPWWFGGSQGENHRYEVRALPQAAFHVYEKVGSNQASVTTLATNGPTPDAGEEDVRGWESPLAGWNTLDNGDAAYSALYPFGWMDYQTDKLATDVQLRFYSPIVAGEDERTSLPVAYFDVQITNTKAEAAEVSTMFTMPNVAGHEGIKPVTVREGLTSQYREADGIEAVTLSSDSEANTPDAYKSEWTIAAKPAAGQTVSYVTSWDASGDGSDIYAAFADGTLDNGSLDQSATAGAIAVKASLQPGETTTIPFVLTWDFPQVSFTVDYNNPDKANVTTWMRRYTEYYGAQTNATNDYVAGSYPFHQSYNIAKDALAYKDKNLDDVLAWWSPITDSATYPDWLKQAALNQVSNLPFHTALWENGLVENTFDPATELSATYPERIPSDRAGNDVPGTHNYIGVDANGGGASTNGMSGEIGIFSQIVYSDLFPNIERDRMRAKAEMIMDLNTEGDPWDVDINSREGGNPFISWHQGYGAEPGKAAFTDRPANNLYRMYDYAQRSGDQAFLDYVYPAMLRTIGFLQDLVPDDCALPEDPGADTFNPVFAGMPNWANDGDTASRFNSYNSSLYILALEAMIEAGTMHGESAAQIDEWRGDLDAARADFERLFWVEEDGIYQYRALVDTKQASDAQFLSQWLAERSGLDNVVDYKHYLTHLQNITLSASTNAMADYATAAYTISAGRIYGNDALVEKGLALGQTVADGIWHNATNPIEFNAGINSSSTSNLYPGWEGVLSVWQILTSLDTQVSKAELSDTLDDADALDETDYTVSAWAKFVAAKDVAGKAMRANSGTQAQVDSTEQALASAIAGLAERASETTVASVLIEVADSLAGLDSFTPESLDVLKAALAEAKAAYEARADLTQAELDATSAKLKAAIEALEPKADVDNSVLQHVYEETTSIARGNYTSESWAALQAAMAKAKAVLASDTATQAEIDAAVKELGTALAGLKQAPAKVTKVKLNQSQLRLAKGKSFTLEDAVYYADGKAAYA